ncbi:MAG: hypothetical protein VXY56_10985, partial [Pseudomonadota bacterium]|nr:hypothetical protein [Pseudomonadota bacterium]
MVAPNFIRARIKSADFKTSQPMEKVFLADEIRRNKKLIVKLKTTYDDRFQLAQRILSPLDLLQLCKYFSSVDKRMDKKKRSKHQSNVARLVNFRFGVNVSPSTDNVTNLSEYVLDSTELFVLSHGLSFSLPPLSIKKE